MSNAILDSGTTARTETAARGQSYTETPYPDADAKQSPGPEYSIDRWEFVSGSEEFGIAALEVEVLISSSNDQENAILNTPRADFSSRVQRKLTVIGWRAPLAGSTLAEVVERTWNFHLSIARDRAQSAASTQLGHQYNSFRSRLVATLRDEPIEDGVAHPAELVIAKVLYKNPSACLNWLSRALDEHKVTQPSLAASIIRCIGRLEYDQVGGWGMRVADDALRHGSVEVREAAVRALEAWGGRKALEKLRNHHDKRPWLDDYVQQVIVDLSRTTP